MSEIRAKNVVLLGATGSIGTSTLEVLRKHPDRLNLIGVAAQSNGAQLANICREFSAPNAVLSSEVAYQATKDEFPSSTRIATGDEALCELSTLENADIVLVAVVGACGLKPALEAIEAGKDIALANKELLVLGGEHVIAAAKRNNVRLLPTDSEHNAIFQCLEGNDSLHVDRLILTASGGQFRDTPVEKLSAVTPEEATKHPNWSMGSKITVDSSTMANKGLELIEAHWLFGLEPDRLDVVLHPQSIAHSFVQFIDGSILAQLSPPSMTFAIQHCLLYPDRALAPQATTDFKASFALDFRPPDMARYPCLELAYTAMQSGGTAPAVFNAANEVAVARFLEKEIGYLDIPKVIEQSLSSVSAIQRPSLDTLFQVDSETRLFAQLCC